jgi:hypothetical protein
MRRIESKKLNLHKETLRTLASAELSVVAGATGLLCQGSIAPGTNAPGGCTVSPGDTSDANSRIAMCHPVIFPNPSIEVNPSLVIGPGGG